MDMEGIKRSAWLRPLASLKRLDVEILLDELIGLRIPLLDIDAIEDADEIVAAELKHPIEALRRSRERSSSRCEGETVVILSA
jgi:hypothetical protein